MATIALSSTSRVSGGTSSLRVTDSSGWVLTQAQPWWSHLWRYRRPLTFTSYPTGLPEDHIVTVFIPREINQQGKVRSDLEDLEIMYLTSTSPAQWVQLGRNVTSTATFYQVDFQLPFDMEPNDNTMLFEGINVNERLYAYYGNPNQTSNQSRPSYGGSEWPLEALYDDPYVTYTYPGIQWIDGYTEKPGARAAFSFYGPQARLYCDVSPSGGMIEVQTDNGDWTSIDLYSPTDQGSTIVHTTDGLSLTEHVLRVRLMPRANPAALANSVQINKFGYRNHSTFFNLTEEHDETLFWSGGMGGM